MKYGWRVGAGCRVRIRTARWEDSPTAPALSQGFGGDTDAIIGFNKLA